MGSNMGEKPGSRDSSCHSRKSADYDDPGHSDSKCLVWLNPDQQVARSQVTDATVSTMSVVCSACGHQINHHKRHNVYMHKDLSVIVCKKCYEYYGDGKFDKDDNGCDEYCTWCAEGGKLLVCDQCSRAFCKNCVRRNLSRREVSRILTLNVWLCYVCDPTQIVGLVRYAEIIQEYAKRAGQPHHPPSSQVLDVSVDNEHEVQDTLCNIAQQLRLMAETIESDVKRNSKTIMKRASSLLRGHLRNVSQVAEQVKSIARREGSTELCSQKGTKTKGRHGRLGSSSLEGEPNGHVIGDDSESSASGSVAARGKRRKHLLASDDESSLQLLQALERDKPPEVFNDGKGDNQDVVVDKHAKKHEESGRDEVKEQTAVRAGSSSSSGNKDREQDPAKHGEEVPDMKKNTADPAGFETEEFVPDLDCLKTLISESQDEVMSDAVVPDSQELFPNDTADINLTTEYQSPSLLRGLQDSQSLEAAAVCTPPKNDGSSMDEQKAGPTSEKLLDCEREETKTKNVGKDSNKNVQSDESSSLSDNEGGICAAETESLKSNSESESLTKGSPANRSARKRAPMSENEKARRALQRSLRESSSGSSSEDEAQDSKLKMSPRICKTTPSKRGRRPPFMESTPNAKKVVKSLDEELPVPVLGEEGSEGVKYDTDDPKLKVKPVVLLPRLQLFVPSTRNGGAAKGKDEIESLLRTPGKVTTRSPKTDESQGEKKQSSKRAKKAAAERRNLLDSSDGALSSEPSDDDEPISASQISKALLKPHSDLSKEALLQSILESSSESDSEDEDPAPTGNKTSKKKKQTKEGDTEDAKDDDHKSSQDEGGNDFEDEEVVRKKSKKWKKYEKLLKKIPTQSGSEPDAEETKAKTEDHSSSKKKASHQKRKLMFSDDEDSAPNAVKRSESSEESSDESSIFDTSNDSMEDFKSSKKKKGAQNSRTTRRSKRSDSGSESEKPKKKRRRIQVASSSGNEDDDDEVQVLSVSQSSDPKGRKNIRKLLTDSELNKRTKVAAQAEEERKKRIKERQKFYNEAMGGAVDTGHDVINELILEIDAKTKTPVVSVDPCLVQCMKPHQAKGVKFMYDCTVETVEMLAKDKKGAGAILAHCMGLGKTFQVISFLHTVLTNEHTKKHLYTALVVCPYNTILNWVEEFARWLEDRGLEIPVHEISAIKDNYTRVDVINLWREEGGVLVMGYDMFRLLVNGKGKRFPAKLRQRIETALLDPGPDIVVCDEGHVLKNDSSNLSKAMYRLRTNRRIVLTGTPLQNNLQEYHCMVNFVKPNLLGTKKEFLNRFVNPIKNGQCADSTFMDVKLMKKRVHILHSLLDGSVQRCDYSALAPFLPPKHEYVISVKLSEQQVSLYRHYLDHFAQNKQTRNLAAGMLCDYSALRNVWTHPYLLHVAAERAALKKLFAEDNDFVNDDSSPEEADKNGDDDDVVCLDDPQPSSSKQEKKGSDSESSEGEVVKSWHTRSRGTVEDEEGLREAKEEQARREREKQWWSRYIPEEDMQKYELSGKMLLLSHILQECESIGDKVLLFSQSLTTLDMVEQMLRQFEERAEAAASDPTALISVGDAMGDCQNTWSLGVDYFRMDGSTSADLRKRWIEIFNSEENQRARLFLISTRAGSLGTNLVGANRVILMDASWNPTHDVQSIFRVYRFGQKKPVFIYRLLAQGTMEEKIYDRQVTKQSLSCRVIDEQQIERHFNAADLQELYTFDPESKSNRPTPRVPKDRLLAELLIRHKDWIVSYHEHDSLLQNITEEDLTEEERKIAWEEYNAEREGRFKINTENAEANEQQQVPLNLGAGPKQLTVDLNLIIKQLREKNPGMTPDQLAINLRSALSAYRQQFRKQQMDAFNLRTTYIRHKRPVPQEVLDRLSRSSMAIQQLNNLLNQLEVTIANVRASTGVPYRNMRMPNMGTNTQFTQWFRLPQQFPQMQRAAWPHANAQFRQPCNSTFRPSTTAPIVCEADDGTPIPERPAQRPPTSSVTITEIID